MLYKSVIIFLLAGFTALAGGNIYIGQKVWIGGTIPVGSSASTWPPSGYQNFWDANNYTTNAGVATLPDLVGGLDLTNPAAASSPTIGPVQGGYPSLSFASRKLQNDAVSASQIYEVDIGYAITNSGGTRYHWSGTNAASKVYHSVSGNAFVNENAGTALGGVFSSPVLTNHFYVIRYIFNGASSAIWINTSAAVTGVAGSGNLSGFLYGQDTAGSYKSSSTLCFVGLKTSAAWTDNQWTNSTGIFYQLTNRWSIAP